MRPTSVSTNWQRTALVAALIPVAVLTACTSGHGSTKTSSAIPAPSSVLPSSGSPSASPSGSAVTSPSSTSSAATPPAPAGPPCTDAALKVTATRLPGAAGTSYALLTFTNQSSTACVLTGYPGVSLLDANGRQLGAAATHTPATAATIGLGANQAASTLLADDSTTCQVSSRSVSVRVYAPNLTQARVLPLALPPCSLSVKPVVAGTSPQP